MAKVLGLDLGSKTIGIACSDLLKIVASGVETYRFAENDLDKEACFLIGDSKRDVEAAEAAGIKGYLFKEGSLLEFVKKIIEG